ncbi:Protein LEAD-SENSITIVE 1 [Linum grandiflorum]
MGLLSHRVERSEIKAGDHIYTYRAVFTYSHHGIYVGGSKVVHFTPRRTAESKDDESSSYDTMSSIPSSCEIFPDCGFRQQGSGVVLTCLDCFLGRGSLYLFEYQVPPPVFMAKLRGGTCTTAPSDPPGTVVHRAMYLLQNGFGNYDVFQNNCEDFALYCRTGLLITDKQGVGRSGQASSVIGAPLAAILSSPLNLLMPNPVGVATVTAGMYCMSRYATDIGVRSDVVKVAVEDLAVNLGWGDLIQFDDANDDDVDDDGDDDDDDDDGQLVVM